jgi:hypothetical protein
MQADVETRLLALHDGLVGDMPNDLDLDQLMGGYVAVRPDASLDDLTMAAIEYALRCTYPELYGEPEERPKAPPPSPHEAKTADPVQEVD